jgi:pimeloyl-ACP methyl ester carboxylesterase
MLRIVPLLADPARFGGDPADAFDVVVPSLPGYAFSDAATTPGFGLTRMAGLLSELMTVELGYERYAARGSEFGASLITQLAQRNGSALVGFHTGVTDPWILGLELPDDLTEAEREFVANARRWNEEEHAYAEVQMTKPQSLAYGLNDSPAGLAAWIVEKFRSWSDCGGDLDRGFIGRDDLLANLTIYWVTQTIGSSMRLYYEARRDADAVHFAFAPVRVPLGIAQPPRDMFPTPREWLERFFRIDRFTELPAGGHFPEWEQPEALADDIRAFFRPLR